MYRPEKVSMRYKGSLTGRMPAIRVKMCRFGEVNPAMSAITFLRSNLDGSALAPVCGNDLLLLNFNIKQSITMGTTVKILDNIYCAYM